MNNKSLSGFIKTQKARLLALKAQLEHEIYQEPDIESSQPQDEGDQAEELTELTTHSAEEKLRLAELARVNEALEKIKQGNYFECSGCKGKIPLARLKAQPSATTCVKCQ